MAPGSYGGRVIAATETLVLVVTPYAVTGVTTKSIFQREEPRAPAAPPRKNKPAFLGTAKSREDRWR